MASQAVTPIINSPADIDRTCIQKTYTLNPEKTIKKKIDATKRVSIEYNATGGGITAKMDAASFEMFKFACEKHFTDLSTQSNERMVNLDKSVDTKGNIVQFTYSMRSDTDSLYTLNLYTTKCTLLINGKSTKQFLDIDLPSIHKLMTNITLQGKKVNIDELNRVMNDQLQKLLDATQKMSTNYLPAALASPVIPISPEKCTKCKKVCRSRAVMCSQNHWVHYKCAKLSSSEIDNIENSNDNIYTCSMHTQLIVPAITNTFRSPNTSAKQILHDENDTADTCSICLSEILSNANSCEKCHLICHTECLNDSQICAACSATDNQHEMQSNATSCSPIKAQSIVVTDGQSQSQSSATDNQEKSQSMILQNVTTILNSTENEQCIRLDNISAKQKQLRALDTKLKKKEDDLKLREHKLKQYENEQNKMENRIESLEARNKQLELTVTTLNSRLQMLDGLPQPTTATTQPPSSSNFNNSASASGYDMLLHRIHDKVTNFILDRVDNQIDEIINNNNKMQNQHHTINSNDYSVNTADNLSPSNNEHVATNNYVSNTYTETTDQAPAYNPPTYEYHATPVPITTENNVPYLQTGQHFENILPSKHNIQPEEQSTAQRTYLPPETTIGSTTVLSHSDLYGRPIRYENDWTAYEKEMQQYFLENRNLRRIVI